MAEGNQPPRKRGRPPKVATEARERTPQRLNYDQHDAFMVEFRAFQVASNISDTTGMDAAARAMNLILDVCRGVR
jgi:hypothetical protein